MKHIVLAYHHFVKNSYDKKSKLYIDEVRFRSHLLSLMESNYKPTISLADCMNETNTFHITIDDGYLNFYNIAYPILKELNIPATLFVPTSRIGITCFEEDYGTNQTYCSKEQLLEFVASGLINVESHGHGHIKLSNHSYREQYEDVEKSLDIFSSLGLKSNVFCYPYGLYNEDTVRILKLLDFNYSCSTVTGVNKTIDEYKIERLAPDSTMNGNDLIKLIKLYK